MTELTVRICNAEGFIVSRYGRAVLIMIFFSVKSFVITAAWTGFDLLKPSVM